MYDNMSSNLGEYIPSILVIQTYKLPVPKMTFLKKREKNEMCDL